MSLDIQCKSGFNVLLTTGLRYGIALTKVKSETMYAKENNEMAKNQTTYIPKDIYFRTPTKCFTTRVVEVKAASVELDGARYKDKYFQVQCTTDGS